ncbi:glycoside hydrolase family 16 protein [Fluviicola sp.]|jgi:beta-glucanase (GH16 family)|uniref:glycoside hydrolase family 16 protein n=1 Tax=Fluviicola sp. TaxID=1917219 RepID=UPI002819B721|nr:glycoside hydrolase family 16 protein [Fluviicola sp.]MDR0803082.1 glycoside hydrolase family 16 protein [Fluviicola sp.]
MKNITLTVIFLTQYLVIFGQTPINDPHWQLIWEDQFNSFDNTKWRKVNNCDHGGEPQLYLSQNVTTANGNLVITLRREEYSCPTNALINVWECGSCNQGMKHYTSGMVLSQVSEQVKYGYIEAMIKLPYGAGYWPAFWTWVGTPNYEEIDIFEMIAGTSDVCNQTLFHNQNVMTSNMHNCNGCIPGNFFCTSNYMTSLISDYTQWHKYAVEWSPSKIIWYVDDYPYRVEENDNKFDPTNIIFNFALNNHDNNAFPLGFAYGGLKLGQSSEMLVNYVKYYKLANSANSCNEIPSSCSYNFATHTNTVKKSITFGNNTCPVTVPSDHPYYFRASEGIQINGDFTVPLGSEIYMDVNPCY